MWMGCSPIMPGGIKCVVLARQACRILPKIKVLLTTGYADASIQRTDMGRAEFGVVNKPYAEGSAQAYPPVAGRAGGHLLSVWTLRQLGAWRGG